MDVALLNLITTPSKRRDTMLVGDFSYPGIFGKSNSATLFTSLADHFVFQKVIEAVRGLDVLDLVMPNREN